MANIFITGICGFAGSTIAKAWRIAYPDDQLFGIDNFSRAGSWLNKASLIDMGIRVTYGDIRNFSDLNLDMNVVVDVGEEISFSLYSPRFDSCVYEIN